MIRKIFKFPFPIGGEVEISMPAGSEILTVQTQGGIPCIWAVVDADAPFAARRLCVRGTGHQFKGNEGKYIGTCQLDNGELVFHVFEEIKE
jgi:hypothetical protein